jgi:hypothetical protein
LKVISVGDFVVGIQLGFIFGEDFEAALELDGRAARYGINHLRVSFLETPSASFAPNSDSFKPQQKEKWRKLTPALA